MVHIESNVAGDNDGLNGIHAECEHGILNQRNNFSRKTEESEILPLVEIPNGSCFTKTDTISETERKRKVVEFRRRLAHTVCLCCSRFTLGWLTGLLGATFPDLRMLIDKDLTISSWIFTAISLGALIGSLIGPVIYNRLPKIPLFIVITCGLGSVAAVIPWCSSFQVMLAVNVVHGIFGGMFDTVATADVVLVWRLDAGPYMQAIYGVVSIGCVVAPFAAEPFLAKKTSTKSNLLSDNRVDQNFQQSSSTVQVLNYTTAEMPKLVNESIFSKTDSIPLYGESNIVYAYSMVTVISVLAGSLFIVVEIAYGNVYNLTLQNDEEKGNMETRSRKTFTGGTLKHVFVGLTTVAIIFYGMGERGFTGFLMTFLINYKDWSKSDSSKTVAIFWITFAIGRLVAIFFVRCFTTTKVVSFHLMCLTTGGILFVVSILTNMGALIWLSVALVGFGMSAILASLCSWFSENITQLTGSVASILIISSNVGQMVSPILLGYLMDEVSQIWFAHANLVIFVLLSGTFLFIVILYKKRR